MARTCKLFAFYRYSQLPPEIFQQRALSAPRIVTPRPFSVRANAQEPFINAERSSQKNKIIRYTFSILLLGISFWMHAFILHPNITYATYLSLESRKSKGFSILRLRPKNKFFRKYFIKLTMCLFSPKT